MAQHDEPTNHDYPHGRGYGHDYMRGGEVFGGYGYSEREEYERRRGELGYPNATGHDGEGVASESPDDAAAGERG
jgi:hypothetical protein